ncbi:hypothetical protein TNCV_2444481 [Trichonephila clavipes]|nr:hypothetical protein TNCV_2444481 [Trichonephila clavipes]
MERRGWDERWRSTGDRRNRNWRDAEVLDRQNDRRDYYRRTYGNGPQKNHGFENRNQVDRDNSGFESRNDSISTEIGVRVRILIKREQRYVGRLNFLRVRVDQEDQLQNVRNPPISLSAICMSPVELPYVAFF